MNTLGFIIRPFLIWSGLTSDLFSRQLCPAPMLTNLYHTPRVLTCERTAGGTLRMKPMPLASPPASTPPPPPLPPAPLGASTGLGGVFFARLASGAEASDGGAREAVFVFGESSGASEPPTREKLP